MLRPIALSFGVLIALTGVIDAEQQRRPAQRRPAPAAAPAVKTEPAALTCPAELGAGVTTKRTFCDVLAGRDPAEGIIVKLPPHTGPVTLSFDLHNRHTYSEQQERAGVAFARYTATIGILTPDNTLLERAVVQSEFRQASDLLDRIEGGAGPQGVKAVAPTGAERVMVRIPAQVQEVSILGERLEVLRIDGPEVFTAPGRPIAVISNATVEYRPAPARR
jgi:hypothetical protein